MKKLHILILAITLSGITLKAQVNFSSSTITDSVASFKSLNVILTEYTLFNTSVSSSGAYEKGLISVNFYGNEDVNKMQIILTNKTSESLNLYIPEGTSSTKRCGTTYTFYSPKRIDISINNDPKFIFVNQIGTHVITKGDVLFDNSSCKYGYRTGLLQSTWDSNSYMPIPDDTLQNYLSFNPDSSTLQKVNGDKNGYILVKRNYNINGMVSRFIYLDKASEGEQFKQLTENYLELAFDSLTNHDFIIKLENGNKILKSVEKPAIKITDVGIIGTKSSVPTFVKSMPNSATLTISSNILNIAAPANSTAIFNITSNIPWTVNSNQTWLTASTASGSGNATITLTASANLNTSTRTAAITVSGTGVTAKTITVTQNGVAPILTAPVAIAATNITQSGFSANWNASETATGYRLDVSTSNTFASFIVGYNNKDVGNVTSTPVIGLNANTPYYYRVRAYNSGGNSGNSNTINLTTLPIPPPTPVAIAATNITQSGFSANWNASATATGYRLDISTSNTFTSFVAGYNNKDVGNVTTSPVIGLNANTPYYYRVRAYNSGGTSGNSNTINLTTLPIPPPTPVAIAATNITQSGFSANWNASATATGYRLDVSTSNTFTSFVTGYNNKDVGNVTTSPVIGLNANTPYYYRVRAYNSGGNSGNSNIINTIIEVLPDLKWTKIEWWFNVGTNPNEWKVGDNKTIFLTVVNNGNADAGAQKTKIYFSADEKYDSKDIKVIDSISYEPIKAGDSIEKPITFNVPYAPNKDYYIIVYVDFNNDVKESDETNNVGVSENKFTITAVTEISDPNYKIYPNPTNRWLTVESSTQDYTLTVYSLEGKILYNKVLSDRVNTIDLNDLRNGLYVIKLENSKNVIIRKIQKL